MGRARGPVISYFRAALVCLFIGTALGLGIGWVFVPVQYTNADPADLRSSFKDDYIRMISAAYELDGNASRASLRIARLGLGDSSQAINDLYTRESKVTTSSRDLRALADLARAVTSPAGGALSRPPTGIPGKTAPTLQPVSSIEPVASFRLVEHNPLTCSDEPEQAHIRVIVRDNSAKDLPNVGIQVSSDKGEDIIYTGLKPERGTGYADLMVVPNIYTVAVVGAHGDSATELQIGNPENCQTDNSTLRGWKLVFQKQ